MTKVKICGIKTLNAAKNAEKYGADFIGFIFWRKSHRYISPDGAKKIASKIHDSATVGVFVDEDIDEVNRIAEMVGLDYVQLHGHEDSKYAMSLKRPVIKAYRFGDNFNEDEANAFPAQYILIDSFQKGKMGGTGKPFRWSQSAEAIKKIKKPVIMAGGISKDNVEEAISTVHPMGVDVSGSLEVNGEKSPELIKEFLSMVKENNL